MPSQVDEKGESRKIKGSSETSCNFMNYFFCMNVHVGRAYSFTASNNNGQYLNKNQKS